MSKSTPFLFWIFLAVVIIYFIWVVIKVIKMWYKKEISDVVDVEMEQEQFRNLKP